MGLHEGRPIIGPRGVIVWHARCHEQRDLPYVAPILAPVPLVVVAPVVVEAPRVHRASIGAPHSLERVAAVAVPVRATTNRATTKHSHKRGLAIAGAVAAIALAGYGYVARPPVTGAANLELVDDEVIDVVSATTKHEPPAALLAWVPSATEAKYPMTSADDGTPLDEKYPSLHAWIHPVTHSAELVPTQPSRLFGVLRVGIMRSECDQGHCGIDLDGPRGRALVAVADGTAVRIERHENGIDNRSGRYIRIQHDDGTFTGYMHLDDVAEIAVGDRVTAGQYVGTLGATAVFTAPPHLHFQLEIPTHAGAPHGDSTDTRFVDPAPFLARATIVKLPSEFDGILESDDVTKKPRRDKRPLQPSM